MFRNLENRFMKKVFFCLMVLTMPFHVSMAGAYSYDNALMLDSLDSVVRNRASYNRLKEDKISYIKQKYEESENLVYRFNVCGDLVNEYRGYVADSQMVYALQRVEMAAKLKDPFYKQLADMNYAEALASSGMYKEAAEELSRIRESDIYDNLLPYWYNLNRTISDWLSDFATTGKLKDYYGSRIDAYNDSLLKVNDRNSFTYAVVKADMLDRQGQYAMALDVIEQYMEQNVSSLHESAILYYGMAEAYLNMGDKDKAKYFLGLSAINDLRSSQREYISLRSLAMMLYADGDIQRSYVYLNTALDDALKCNARMRTFEVSQIFPVVVESYRSEINRQKSISETLSIVLSVVAVLFLAGSVYFYVQMRRKAALRKQTVQINEKLRVALEEIKNNNAELENLNARLRESNLIKEEYLTQYMEFCVAYMSNMDTLHKKINKCLQMGSVKDLRDIVEDFSMKNEWKKFYATFDSTFLHLFPDFIEKFNALLQDDAKVKVPEDGKLNTDLRVYALIRLGITDSVKIAHFLSFSVTTIYNVRTKLRNGAACARDEFESKVMEII